MATQAGHTYDELWSLLQRGMDEIRQNPERFMNGYAVCGVFGDDPEIIKQVIHNATKQFGQEGWKFEVLRQVESFLHVIPAPGLYKK